MIRAPWKTPLLACGLALLGAAAPGSGQEDAEARVVLIPRLGVSWHAVRYERAGTSGGQGSGGVDGELAPRSGLVLGAGVEVAVSPSLSLDLGAGWSRVAQELVVGPPDDRERVVSGSGTQLTFLHAAGGVVYRVRPGAPGFFSGGVAVARVRMGDPFWLDDQEDRTELGAYLGAGLDVGSGSARLRVEGRIHGVAPNANEARRGSVVWEPKAFVVEPSLSLGVALSR